MSREKAETKIRAFLNDVQVEMDVNDSKKLKIRSNPGFEVIINKEQFTNNINILVNNINNIAYLKTIPIYIDTLIRISQKEPISIDPEFLNNMCNIKVKSFDEEKEKEKEKILKLSLIN